MRASHQQRSIALITTAVVLLLQDVASFTSLTTPNGNRRRGSNVDTTQPLRSCLEAAATTTAVNGAVDEHKYDNFRLSTCEKARTVTSVCTSGTLCTVSCAETQGIAGAPFGSFVDYVLDSEGNPVFLMNERSLHTVNIEHANANAAKNEKSTVENSMVTLFTQLSTFAGSPRCSITGRIQRMEDDDADVDAVRMKYSLTHSYADQVMDSPRFGFYRLVPSAIYFVAGFGVLATWVPPQDYRGAAPDILASEASGIADRLNKQSVEDLFLTATHFLLASDGDSSSQNQRLRQLEDVKVTNVDRLGMDIRVTHFAASSGSGGSRGSWTPKLTTDEFRVGFRIPVLSVEDAKSEIQKVFQEAWEVSQGYTWDTDDDDEALLPGGDVPIFKIAADGLS